jgi:hypothetical protein
VFVSLSVSSYPFISASFFVSSHFSVCVCLSVSLSMSPFLHIPFYYRFVNSKRNFRFTTSMIVAFAITCDSRLSMNTDPSMTKSDSSVTSLLCLLVTLTSMVSYLLIQPYKKLILLSIKLETCLFRLGTYLVYFTHVLSKINRRFGLKLNIVWSKY